MCGIAYLHDFTGKPVNNRLLDQFDRQRARGTQGFGLYDGKHLVKHSKEDGILKWLVTKDSDLILFHHRLPTSVGNAKRTAHPFTTGKYFGKTQYILVHNGHISNAKTLKGEHEKLGIRYQSVMNGDFNDSESLLWDIALTLEGKQKAPKVEGGLAFVCIKTVKGKPDKLYFGRNHYPLNMLRDKNGIMLSSTGEGESITPHRLYTWNYKLKRLTNKPMNFDKWEYTPSKYTPETYEPYQVGEYIPPSTTGETYHSWERYDDNRLDLDDLEELAEGYMPEAEEVVSKVFVYLSRWEGNIDNAYMDAEYDYMQIAEDIETLDEYREMRMLEEVMDWFRTDPDYLNGRDISSAWEVLKETHEELAKELVEQKQLALIEGTA